MKLLLVNDDGYQALGLIQLAERLSKDHDVYVVSPSSNRSAVSHHITMFSDTEIHKISERLWTCDGYPSDCSCIGIISDLFDVKFDGVISGINYGPNLGTDIVYSGTCAGARQAVFTGVPAIAVSVDSIDWAKANKEGFYFENLADFIANNLETLLGLSSVTNPRTFVNVNAPAIPEYKGVKISNDLCIREYHDKLSIVEKNGHTVSEFKPGQSTAPAENPLSDYSIVQAGYICVSLVYADAVAAKIVDGISFKL